MNTVFQHLAIKFTRLANYTSPGLIMTSSFASSSVNPQLQSPLFGTLPGEIRNEIFALVLMQYEDEAELYPEDSYWYRPGFTAPRKSDSALLRTCRAAYAEGKKVYLKDLEWAFWFGTCISPRQQRVGVCEHHS
jgi:hypothetical protein